MSALAKLQDATNEVEKLFKDVKRSYKRGELSRENAKTGCLLVEHFCFMLRVMMDLEACTEGLQTPLDDSIETLIQYIGPVDKATMLYESMGTCNDFLHKELTHFGLLEVGPFARCYHKLQEAYLALSHYFSGRMQAVTDELFKVRKKKNDDQLSLF